MPLPRWATLIRRAPSAGQDPVSLPEEEAYVRTRCYHEASRTIDTVWKASLDLSFLRHGIHDKILVRQTHQSRQDDKVGPPRRKRCRTEPHNDTGSANAAAEQGHGEEDTSDTNESTVSPSDSLHSQQPADNISALRKRFCLKPSTRLDPRILPVHLLSGPSTALDRLAWMKYLVDTAQRDTNGAIVWLQQGPPTSWVTEIMRQLYILQPPPSRAAGLKQLSVTENLIHWCRLAAPKFDFIQIYVDLQTVRSATSPVNTFLHWLAHARAHHGIPFSAVVLESSGPRRHDICSYQQGTNGMVLHRHALPSALTLLKDLLTNPKIADLVTVLFRPVVTTSNWDRSEVAVPLWTTFETTGSTVLVLLEWKRRLANHLSSPGSFLTLDCDIWLDQERRRLEWMLSSKHVQLARILKNAGETTTFELTSWRDQARVKRTMAVLSWKMRHIVVQKCRLQSSTVDLWKNLTDRRPYLEPLAKARSAAVLKKHNSSSSLLLVALNEMVVLLDNCTNLQEVLHCLDAYQQEWTTLEQQLPFRFCINNFPRPMQPRRDLVEGLVSKENEQADLSSVPGILYSCFNHRVSIGFSEWMQIFSDQPICLEVDPSETAAFFSTGVNMLKIQGLIRERKTVGKNDPVFEKTAVVFSSGA